jgi:CBS domain-containing protein
MPASAITAKMIASSPVTTISDESSLDQAAQIMKRSKIKHLPVVSDGKLVGIVSDIDIVFEMPSMMSAMEEVCRPQK